jgi:hypothetical protein
MKEVKIRKRLEVRLYLFLPSALYKIGVFSFTPQSPCSTGNSVQYPSNRRLGVVGVSPFEPFREEKNVMLMPGIETLFRGQLACKLISPTALFHDMRSGFEDERVNWNVGGNILRFFVYRMSHIHCLGIEHESQ